MGQAKRLKKERRENPPIKLDIGCGPNPLEGFEGVDVLPFGGKVKHVMDVRGWARGAAESKHGQGLSKFKDNSIDEIHCSHFLEHLTGRERVPFMNECYRILKPYTGTFVPGQPVGGVGTMRIITPHWCSARAYGDPTHEWPPVSEMWYEYLLRDWRKANAPHADAENAPGMYTCNFKYMAGYSIHPDLNSRASDYQTFAIRNYKDAAQDTLATIVALKP